MSQLWYVTEHCRQYIQMSYKFDGSGRASRQPQFIVHQCVHMLYALRCIYIIHCLVSLQDHQVSVPARLSEKYLNCHLASSFTAIQNIKRPAKGCIDDHHRQNVSWVDDSFTALEVHTGINGLGRAPVTHIMLRQIFGRMVADISALLGTLGNCSAIPVSQPQTALTVWGMSQPLNRSANSQSFGLHGLKRFFDQFTQGRGPLHLQQELALSRICSE